MNKYTKEEFIYPTPFELHFGNDHLERYARGEITEDDGKGDPDLANHFMLTYHRGVCVYGQSIKDTFDPVDPKYYIQSNWEDVKAAKTGILENPVYNTLNLCRFLQYLIDGTISSKQEGGEWFLKQKDIEYHDLVSKALSAYASEKMAKFRNQELVEFAEYMLGRINKLNLPPVNHLF
ncbi:MAG: DUF4111 domain-containing protein [Candidatus Uhrbacteria bacterium]